VRALFITLGFLLNFTSASAEPLNITTTPLDRFALLTNATSFGPFTWRGGLALTSTNKKFGGLSGLVMGNDCTSLLAVSDAGSWVKADVAYTNSKIVGLTSASIAPILDGSGKPPRSKARGDAEALASLGSGRYMVGFESFPRIGIYNIGKSGLVSRFQLLKSPKAITEGPPNAELESVGRITTGRWKNYDSAISENYADQHNNVRGWLWQSWKTVPFTVKRYGNYNITDLVVLPAGDVLILERGISASLLPGMAIRRFKASAITTGGLVEPELLMEAKVPFYAIDNMEGLAVCERDGELRVNLVSDNNFNTELQRTLLLQFSYKP
jgi:hypothetical protein